MKTIKFFPRIGSAALFIALLATTGSASPTRQVQAQPQTGIQVSIDSCDTTKYPAVTCVVLPTEGAGVPSRGLSAQSFEVSIDESLKATDVTVEEFDGADTVRTDTMLLVDFGMTQGGKAIDALRQVTTKIVQNARDADNIGFIAVMGKIDLGDTLNPPLNDQQESDFKSVLEARNYIINMVNALDPKPKTPLYDALCKALILTAKRKIGARAVVVISDGNDKKASVSCEADDPISRANKDRVPVFAVAVGNNLNSGYLNRLAIQTNGVYLVAAAFDQGPDRYEEIQKMLRTRYRIKFTSPLKADAAAHKINIVLNLPSGKAQDAVAFNATAPFPLLESLVMLDQRLPPDSEMTLPQNDVTVQPLFVGQPVSRVEFELETPSGMTTYEATAEPWTYTFVPKDIDGAASARLTIRAYGTDENNVGTYTYQVVPAQPRPVQPAVQGSGATSSTPQPTDSTSTPSSSRPALTLLQRLLTPPMTYIVFGLAILVLISLIVVVVISSRRRSQTQTVTPTDVIPNVFGSPTSFTELRTGTMSDGATSLMDGSGMGDSHTMVMDDAESGKTMVLGGEEGGKTMVYSPPVARLKITSGPQSGKVYDLGSAMSRNVAVGREVEEGMSGNIRISSKFVSRLHARIALVEDSLILTDEKSASGTKVDGVPVREGERIQLRPGMVVHFGDVTAVIEAP